MTIWFESLTWQTIVVCPTFAPLIVCSTTVLMPWETDIWVCHYKQNDQYKLPPFMSCIMANTSESANKNTPTTTYQRPRRINNFLFMVRTGYCTISWTRQIPEKKKKWCSICKPSSFSQTQELEVIEPRNSGHF